MVFGLRQARTERVHPAAGGVRGVVWEAAAVGELQLRAELISTNSDIQQYKGEWASMGSVCTTHAQQCIYV